jgi:hypothetical protein
MYCVFVHNYAGAPADPQRERLTMAVHGHPRNTLTRAELDALPIEELQARADLAGLTVNTAPPAVTLPLPVTTYERTTPAPACGCATIANAAGAGMLLPPVTTYERTAPPPACGCATTAVGNAAGAGMLLPPVTTYDRPGRGRS